MNLVEQLKYSGMIAQISSEDDLLQHLESGSRSVYCGFDPTADSLHIGNLVPLLALKKFQLAGHKPILLMGGATGIIGDPSGRDSERELQTLEAVEKQMNSIRLQAREFLDFDCGKNSALLVNNLDWISEINVVDYLRDIGKHFSVNSMMQKESVRRRIVNESQGISYTEFSYMILQSYDYQKLNELYGCSLQIGGSDQWGNIVSGVDLVRRNLRIEAHALTLPLVTKADGTKFGKTASGAIWLDKDKTSPYSFYQYWLNVADEDAAKFLKYFTFLSKEEIEESAKVMETSPQERYSQRLLAENVTEIVHGRQLRNSAQKVSEALFKGDVRELEEEDIQQLELDGLELFRVNSGDGLLAAMSDSGMAKSRGEARSLVKSGGVSLNSVIVTDEKIQLRAQDALFGKYFFLRRGKKVYKLLIVSGS